MLLEDHVADTTSISGWPGCMSTARREPGLVERLDGVLGEADALVALEDGRSSRRLRPVIRRSRSRIDGRDVGDLEAAGLARIHRAAERVERLQEERAHEVRLEAPGLGLLHLLLHREEALGAHRLLGERVAVEDDFEVVAVEGVVDLLVRRARTSGWSP